jgi:hypothetical protein
VYGVPSDLDFSVFIGQVVVQVAIGPHDVQVRIHPDLVISIWGKWELRDAAGNLIEGSPNASIVAPCTSVAIPTFLPRIVNQNFVRWHVSAPDWFELEFATGDRLRVFDDSPHYESCSIGPSGVII